MHHFATPEDSRSALEAELAAHLGGVDEVARFGLLIAVVNHTIVIHEVHLPAARDADWWWAR